MKQKCIIRRNNTPDYRFSLTNAIYVDYYEVCGLSSACTTNWEPKLKILVRLAWVHFFLESLFYITLQTVTGCPQEIFPPNRCLPQDNFTVSEWHFLEWKYIILITGIYHEQRLPYSYVSALRLSLTVMRQYEFKSVSTHLTVVQ
jgi:hypothetical protein